MAKTRVVDNREILRTFENENSSHFHKISPFNNNKFNYRLITPQFIRQDSYKFFGLFS